MPTLTTRLRLAGALLLSLVLSGCFSSTYNIQKDPGVTNVFPLREGKYRNAKDGKILIVTRSGDAYVMVSADPDLGSASQVRFLRTADMPPNIYFAQVFNLPASELPSWPKAAPPYLYAVSFVNPATWQFAVSFAKLPEDAKGYEGQVRNSVITEPKNTLNILKKLSNDPQLKTTAQAYFDPIN